jgi:hypothetical protein
MRKYIYTLITILAFHVSASSQAHYVFIDFKDLQKPGVQTEFAYPEKTVNTAIDDRLKKMGYKSKDVKGYAMYQGVTLPEIGTQTYDLYFRVDKKSKKDKDNSVVSMLVSSGNENFITDATDSNTMSNAKKFLDNLMPSVAAYDLSQQIKAQQDELKKAEKKYKSLQSDADDLQKRKKKVEQQIVDNEKDQKDQSSEVEKQRQVLSALMARQK